MPQPCKVCASPDRFEIDRLVAEGRPKRSVARCFGLHPSSVERHSETHLLPDVVRAAERSRLANAGTCQEIARRILQRALEGVDEARGPDAIAKLVTAATNAARLLGQVTGEVQTNVQVLILNQLGVKDESEARALIERGRKMKALETEISLEQAREDAEEVLRLCLRQKPEWRASVIARLNDGDRAMSTLTEST